MTKDQYRIIKDLERRLDAIEWIEGLRDSWNDKDNVKYCNMAIKALEQESILDKIIAEIKEWYWQADKQALAKDPCVVDAMIDLFIRTIKKYKAESKLDGDPVDIDKAVEHYEGTLETLKGIDLEVE